MREVGRFTLRDDILRRDPEREARSIMRDLGTLEFPWDSIQALSFALFRTYAVPSIGRLLFETGEFTERTQKRHDDTVLVLDEILMDGVDGERGRQALRRMNQMHRHYDISNDDFRYVLSTFVVSPIRWIDEFGWRRTTQVERDASVAYYRELARHMNIQDVPTTYDGFCDLLDTYEAEHFAYDEGARAVADATMRLFATFPPQNLAPWPLVRLFVLSIMGPDLCRAFDYAPPPVLVQQLCRSLVRLRGRVVRFLPPRRRPKLGSDLSYLRTYPGGYDVTGLGTFPTACPVDPTKTG